MTVHFADMHFEIYANIRQPQHIVQFLSGAYSGLSCEQRAGLLACSSPGRRRRASHLLHAGSPGRHRSRRCPLAEGVWEWSAEMFLVLSKRLSHMWEQSTHSAGLAEQSSWRPWHCHTCCRTPTETKWDCWAKQVAGKQEA